MDHERALKGTKLGMPGSSDNPPSAGRSCALEGIERKRGGEADFLAACPGRGNTS